MTANSPRPDVAIVGGGIIGAAAAAFLAEAGARVTLHEREAIAAAASGRNSGVVQHPLDPVLVDLYRESLALYRQLTEDAVASDNFALPAEPAGLLAVGHDERASAALAAEWTDAYPDAAPVVLSGRALLDVEPALAADVVACRLAIGYPVAPAAATRAFATRARRLGAQIEIGREVRLAFRDGAVVGVEVDGRVESAGSVVVAAGPWTPSLVDPSGAWRPIRAVWGLVAELVLERPPRHVVEEADIKIEPGSDAPIEESAGEGVAFSLVTAGGASSLGSTFLQAEPDPARYEGALRRRGARFVPEVGRAASRSLRTCARPVSLDGRPLVGAVPWLPGAYVSAGNGPWGISTGPATARHVAELVLGHKPAIPTALDAARFGGPADQREPLPG